MAIFFVVFFMAVAMSMQINCPMEFAVPVGQRIVHHHPIETVQPHSFIIADVGKEISAILGIMVSRDKYFIAIETSDQSVGFFHWNAEAQVAKKINGIVRMNAVVIAFDERFVHLRNIKKWPSCHADNCPMTQMQIAGEVNHIFPLEGLPVALAMRQFYFVLKLFITQSCFFDNLIYFIVFFTSLFQNRIMDFGTYFVYYRKKAGLTQKEAAHALGVNSYCLSNYETNRSEPSLAVLIMMSHVYRVSIDALLANPPLSASADPDFDALLQLIDSYVGEKKKTAIDLAMTILHKI
jgi:transcriptional regulator with XRE-family HTH domain